jgi:tRNA pseudouridine32 synthase / 23S rRNA pseudouridine746 synthase
MSWLDKSERTKSTKWRFFNTFASHLENYSPYKITYFTDESVKDIALPERFTFPFLYEPHPLTRIAAAELQHYLETAAEQDELDHDFSTIGKMFGVLVVQDSTGRLGYLSAFSGKLAGSNEHSRFVPPVFDMLVENSFFLKGQEILNNINARVSAIAADPAYQDLQSTIEQLTAQSSQEIAAFKEQLKNNKAARKQQRLSLKDSPDFDAAEAELVRQSLYDKHLLKKLTDEWDATLSTLRAQLAHFEDEMEALKNERKERSADLQQQLFEQYTFLNKAGETKSLQEIFSQTVFGKPPSAAGECAMPKLLQFAFAHGYHPLAMGEFWWGAPPKSEIRQHKHFYPSCTGKCKPILAHMLEGIPLEDNPFLLDSAQNHTLEIVFEDEHFVVVNKPPGLRSVPGVNIADSVYTRLKFSFEPFMIHRLDMDTSGLLVVAKTASAHKHIQRQFLQRTVSKRYTALLSKAIDLSSGEIDLPLCPDLLNRPRQLVCFKEGKKSITKWQVVTRYEDKTKVHFWPLTGRTHQLRMHAAHELGLNAPIIGDDLYGVADTRMYLQAARLEFIHPVSKEKVCFEVEEEF